MSFLSPSPNMPKTGAERTAYDIGGPLPVIHGTGRVALKWFEHPWNHWVQEHGDIGPHVQYYNVAGLLCHGLIDRIESIWVNGKASAWVGVDRSESNQWCYTFTPTLFNPDKYAQEAWVDGRHTAPTFYFYWGMPGQAQNFLLTGAGGEYSPNSHPPYDSVCYCVIQNFPTAWPGDARKGGASMPNIEFVLYKKPATIVVGGEVVTRGVSPIGVAYEWLTNKIWGLGLPTSLVPTADWTTAATNLKTNGYNQLTGENTMLSPHLFEQKEAGQHLTELFNYFDGFIKSEAGLVLPGWFEGGESEPEGLTVISRADMTEEAEIEPGTWDGCCTEIKTKIKEYDTGSYFIKKSMSDFGISEKYSVTKKILAEPKSKEVAGGAILQPDQGRAYLKRILRDNAVPRIKGRLTCFRDAARWADGTPLMPGDLFHLDYEPIALDLCCRVIERDDKGSNEVALRFEAERGMFPTEYRPEPDTRDLPEPPEPTAFAHWRLLRLPHQWHNYWAPVPCILAQRENPGILGAEVYISSSPTFASDIAQLDNLNSFAVYGELQTAIDSDDEVVKFSFENDDLSYWLAKSFSEVEALDDTMLIVIGNEIISLKDIVSSGSGWREYNCLRGRGGTTAVGHSEGVGVFIIPREKIIPIINQKLDPELAADKTVYFRLCPYTPFESGDMSNITGYAVYKNYTVELTTPGSGATLYRGKVCTIDATVTSSNGMPFWSWIAINPPAGSGLENITLGMAYADAASRTIHYDWTPDRSGDGWQCVVCAQAYRGGEVAYVSNSFDVDDPPFVCEFLTEFTTIKAGDWQECQFKTNSTQGGVYAVTLKLYDPTDDDPKPKTLLYTVISTTPSVERVFKNRFKCDNAGTGYKLEVEVRLFYGGTVVATDEDTFNVTQEREVTITASAGNFVYDPNTEAWSPASITLMAAATNFDSPTYQWYKWNTGTSLWDALSGQTASTLARTPAQVADPGDLFGCVVSDGSYVHDIKTFYLFRFQAGSSAQFAYLTNPAHTVHCDEDGTPESGELGPSGQAVTDIKAYRGGTALTAVASSPTTGQFSFSIVSEVGGDAVKSDNDTMYLDSMSADTAKIGIAVNLEGEVTLSLTWTSAKVYKGVTGDLFKYIYKRATTAPSTPTSPPVPPTGWTYDPPSGSAGLWISIGRIDKDGDLVGTWSAPVRLSGFQTFYQDAAPTGSLLEGDLWFDTNDGYKLYRYDGDSWENSYETMIAASRIISGVITTAEIELAGAAIIKSEGVTDYDTGAGLWIKGDDVNSQFRIGDPAGARLEYDQATGYIKIIDAGGSQIDLSGLVKQYSIKHTIATVENEVRMAADTEDDWMLFEIGESAHAYFLAKIYPTGELYMLARDSDANTVFIYREGYYDDLFLIQKLGAGGTASSPVFKSGHSSNLTWAKQLQADDLKVGALGDAFKLVRFYSASVNLSSEVEKYVNINITGDGFAAAPDVAFIVFYSTVSGTIYKELIASYDKYASSYTNMKIQIRFANGVAGTGTASFYVAAIDIT